MRIDNFEKKIQSTFEQYRPETDHDQIWENIEPHLKKKKKRRAFILFFWALGMGLLGFCGIQKRREGFSGRPGPSFREQNYTEVESNAPARFPESGLSEKSGTANITAASSNEEQKQQAGNVVRNKTYRADNQPVEARNAKKQSGQKSIQNPSGSIKLDCREEVYSTLGEVPQKTANESAVSIQPGPEMPLANESSSVVKKAETPDPQYTPPDSISSRSKAEKSSVLPKKKPSKAKKMNRIKPHKRKQTKQTLSLHTGLVLPLKVLRENNGVTENAELLANRKSSEKMLEAFSSSIHYTYASRKGLLFRGGVEYKRLNEQFSFGYTKKEEEIVTGVLTQTINSSGDVIAQTTGPKKVTTTRTLLQGGLQ